MAYNRGLVGAIVLAAGLSTRMGRPKMTLPWGGATVLDSVLRAFQGENIEPVVVVTGSARHAVEQICSTYPTVETVFTPDFENGEMTDSIKAGIRVFDDGIDAVFIAPGDHPGMQGRIIRQILEAYKKHKRLFVVPSFQMHRGHPWLVDRRVWPELENLGPTNTLRDLLKKNADQIEYVVVDNDSVLRDIDTPQDYQAARSKHDPGV